MPTTVYRNLLDEELLHRIAQKQDKDAFGTLYKRYAHLALGVGLKYLPSERAKDVVQTVFVKIWAEAGKHQVRVFKPWLYTVVKNQCLMELRKNNPEVQMPEDSALHFMESDYSVHHHLEKEQLLTALEDCIENLKLAQRVCIEQFYIQQKTYAEVAKENAMEESLVKSYIQNGRRNLKNCLENKNSQS